MTFIGIPLKHQVAVIIFGVLCFSFTQQAWGQTSEQMEHKLRELQFQIDQLKIAISKGPEGSAQLSFPSRANPTHAEQDYTSLLKGIQETRSVLADLTNRVERLEFLLQQTISTKQPSPAQPSPAPLEPVNNEQTSRQLSETRQTGLQPSTDDENTEISLPPVLDDPFGIKKQEQDAQQEGEEEKLAASLELNEEDLYQRSYDSLQKGDFDAARRGLIILIDRFSESPLLSNAYYWIGESYYAQQRFGEAAETFLKGYQDYPEGNKAAASLFKLGMSLTSLNKVEDACTAFSLANNYAGEEAQVAELAAKQLKLLCQ